MCHRGSLCASRYPQRRPRPCKCSAHVQADRMLIILFRLDFATKKPGERLESISNGLSVRLILSAYHHWPLITNAKVLAYGQSDYVRQFGLAVEPGPLRVHARVLTPPTLKYGPGSRSLTIVSSHYRVRRMSLTTFRPREMVVGTWPTRNSSSL
jgi:hypothetical protein